MATKTNNSTENIAVHTITDTAEANQATSRKLIVAIRKFDRWFVYFKGVAPKDNVGCGCKTARCALRYMYLLKARTVM